jgi:hypothetical protein
VYTFPNEYIKKASLALIAIDGVETSSKITIYVTNDELHEIMEPIYFYKETGQGPQAILIFPEFEL